MLAQIEREIERFFFFKPSTQKFGDFMTSSGNKMISEKSTAEKEMSLKTSPQRIKFSVCPDPKVAEELNPKVVYSIIDEEESRLVMSKIFEVKKNIMSDFNDTSSEDQKKDQSESPAAEHARLDRYNVEDRYYTKLGIQQQTTR